MKELIPVWTRIILRYGTGALAAYALLPDWLIVLIQGDPELSLAITGSVAVVVESWYTYARKTGGPT